MKCALRCTALALATAALSPALGVTFVETFSNGSNVGGWTYFAPVEYIDAAGGNPGAYLHADDLDTFAPQPRSATPSLFTRNYRQFQVSSIGVDLITHHVDFSAGGRPLALMLYEDNGTPGSLDDDWAAYTLGPNIPEPGQGWLAYDFTIPYAETTLPAGWNTIALGPDSPLDPDWNDVITDVDSVGFFYGDPTFFFIFQMWEVGLDNARITYVPEPAALLIFALAAGWRRR